MSKSILTYGESGSGKTSSIAFLAKYIYSRTGKPTRLITLDGGGFAPLNPLINAGMIEIFELNLKSTAYPLDVIRRLSEGEWVVNGTLKATSLESVGAYAIEGLSAISDMIFRYLTNKGVRLTQEPAYKVQDGGTTFFGGNLAYYQFVQNELENLIIRFNGLPVQKVLWTALEGRGDGGEYGPATVGKKQVSKLPAWFGTTIHHETVSVDTKRVDPLTKTKILETEFRGYFMRHPDPITGMFYPAKSRVAASAMPELLQTFPDGYFPITINEGIDKYLKLEDTFTEKETDFYKNWMVEAEKMLTQRSKK